MQVKNTNKGRFSGLSRALIWALALVWMPTVMAQEAADSEEREDAGT